MARSRLTFSLVGLFGLVTVACVAVAALKASTPLWASVVFSGTLLVLAFALLGCWLGTKRRLWAGIALFGWGFIALTCGPLETSVRQRLVTTHLLLWANDQWHGPPVFLSYVSGLSIQPPIGALSNFEQIGHSLFAIVFAALGAFAAGCFPDKRTPSRTR